MCPYEASPVSTDPGHVFQQLPRTQLPGQESHRDRNSTIPTLSHVATSPRTLPSLVSFLLIGIPIAYGSTVFKRTIAE